MMQLARNPVLSLAFLASLLSITAFVPTSSAFVVVHPTRTLLSPSSSHKHQPNTALLQPNQKVLAPKENQPVSKSIIIRSKSSRRYLALSEPASTMLASVFQFNGVPLWQAFGVNAVGFLALQKVLSKMLTGEGQVHALFLGTSLWKTLGWRGWSVCVAYLFLGVLVTKVKFAEKEEKGIAESRGGRRGPENLWGSAATGLMCAIASTLDFSSVGISSDLFVLAYVASLATKLADTFASEIGKAYGKTTFLITTLERVEPGTEGAISAEGTAAAVVGGLILSLYGYAVGMISVPGIIVSTIAAFLATNVESFLGATLQEKEGLEWISNEVINFFNTLVGAFLAMVGGLLFLQM